MQIVIDINEARFKDIQRIADVQLEMCHFQTAEQIIAKGVPIEQEPILDKIRAEIEEERVHDDWDFGQEIYYNNAIKDVLKIIDKYKAESEE